MRKTTVESHLIESYSISREGDQRNMQERNNFFVTNTLRQISYISEVLIPTKPCAETYNR